MGCGSSTQSAGATAGGGAKSRPGGKGKGATANRSPSLHGNMVTNENRNVNDIYELADELGKGTGTDIVIAKSKKYIKTKSTMSDAYAIKLYNGKSDNPPNLGREAAILMDCDHPNIIKLYEMAKINKRISLVLECCKGGSVLDRMPYDEKDASRIMRQVLSAVAYLHHKNIVHRDIELSNILFESNDPKSDIKLIDFGCAKRLEEHPERPGVFRALSEKTGSVHAMAPEVVKPNPRYSSKADVWSVGVAAYMILNNGRKPFDGETVEDVEASILKGYPSYKNWEHSKSSIKFVQDCLDQSAATRPTSAMALKHDWINASRPIPILPNALVISFGLYGRSSPIKRVALNVLARKAAPNVISEYRQLFRDLDVNQSGTLTKEEFLNGFAKSGNTPEELEELFTKLDVNCNNEIMYTEFLAATIEASGELEESQLQEAFDLLDEDHSGVISRKNLLKMLGDSPAVKASVEKMLEGHDDLDFDDFLELFQHDMGGGGAAKTHGIDTIVEEEDDE